MKQRLIVFLTALLCSAALASAQSTVNGSVVDANGEPVIGAAVYVEGFQSVGTLTDLDGLFTLKNVPEKAKYVVASCMGYKDQRQPISTTLKFVLEDDSTVLDAAVATGMQTVDRRLMTGSTTKVDAESAKLAGIADISRSLEGQVAGVSVQNVSGTFGTAPKIRVRGATSIYGSSKPLWVVDGVIMEDVVDVSADDLSSGDASTLISSAIAGLNSDDIESFDILKDGSATSIYGARAMAGVIVVTTKKGKAGQSHISYTGEYTVRLKPMYSTFNIMNSQDQMSIYQELQQKGYLNYAETANSMNSGIYGKMYQLITQYDETSGKFGLQNTPEARAAYLRAAEYRNTDWFDLLFSNSIQHNHSVSTSGGTDNSNYYASLSLMDDPGWTLQSSVQRYTANLNTTYKIFQNLSVNMIANASFRKQRAPGTLSSEIDPVYGEVKRDFDINPYSYALNTSRALDPDEYYTRNYAPFNIKDELNNNYIDLNVQDIRVQGEIKYKVIPELELSAIAAAKYTQTSQEHNILDGSNQAQAYRAMGTSTIRSRNPFLYTDPDNPYALPISVLPNGGIYERSDNNMLSYDFRATANFSKTFADKHIVNLFAGTEWADITRHNTWFRGWGLQYTMGEIPNYAYQVFKQGSEENSNYFSYGWLFDRSEAYFANGTYSYQGKYVLNGTYRYEGTNKLGKSRSARWLPTWNISGAWNISDEPFWRPLQDAISHLSLKASYSLTADRGPSYVTNSMVVISSKTPWRPFANIREVALDIDQLANTELTYEKKNELNLGLEAGFFNNRVNFTFDWYTRNNFDLIGPVNTPGVGGEVVKYGNVAEMKSDGFEISLTTQNIKTRDFNWTTNIIYSHSHNIVTKLQNTTRVINLITGSGFAQQGYPVRGIFSIPFMGLNEEGLPTFRDQDAIYELNNMTGKWDLKEDHVSVSDIYFQTSDPDKLHFLEYSGNADPTDVGSIGNVFTYKGLRLNVFITYSFGNVIRLDPVFSSSYNDLDSMPKEFNNRWTVPGDENITDVPVIASSIQNRTNTELAFAYNAYNYSTARIARGDFIRMKEISLGYDFPKKVTNALHVGTLSLKLQATNLFLLYADKKLNGQDPEFFNTGGVAVPVPKQFTMTFKFGF
ncbi:MAG: SusC/RagA family TonB-linked outer membrane protein [Bacteroidales bacterium]|nr:SusC/RagA family TonB-linked outer membrane protein [Bacteroidales bacterium]